MNMVLKSPLSRGFGVDSASSFAEKRDAIFSFRGAKIAIEVLKGEIGVSEYPAFRKKLIAQVKDMQALGKINLHSQKRGVACTDVAFIFLLVFGLIFPPLLIIALIASGGTCGGWT